MADDKPEWIQGYVWGILLGMKPTSGQDDSYYDTVEKLLTDGNLSLVWDRLNAALKSVDYGFQMGAAIAVIDGICSPVEFYGTTGTAARPTQKIAIKLDRARAQSHLQAASKHLMKAVGEIQKAAEISRMLPDETTTIAGMVSWIFERAGHKDAINPSKIPDNFWNYARGLKTAVFLEEMAARLAPDPAAAMEKIKYLAGEDMAANLRPGSGADEATKQMIWEDIRQMVGEEGTSNLRRDLYSDPWADVPGMRSNKATRRDWMAEAVANLKQASVIYGADFSLRENNWLAVARVLIGQDISRDLIKEALRTAGS